jgi:hypothetical protein
MSGRSRFYGERQRSYRSHRFARLGGNIAALSNYSLPPTDITHITPIYFCDDKKLADRALTSNEKQGVLNNSTAIYLYGAVIYDDIFRFSHTTHYRRFTNGKFGLSDGSTNAAKNGNEAD